MGKCTAHPDRETSYQCLKHKIYLCNECLACKDPELYCKFRPSCIIWFMTKKESEHSLEKATTAPL